MAQPLSTPDLRLGTRGSKLARAQAEIVREALAREEQLACRVMVVKTTGDRELDRPLAEIGGKGLFTKEIETALLGGDIDLAVHSMKDMPTELPPGLVIGAVLPREDARDAFVSRIAGSLGELPKGARIGTGSVRRSAQVARMRSDVEIVPLRGNVDTRLAKLDSGSLDAILLAYAGLKRLGLEERATAVLPIDSWLPALSQGAIGIEIRDADKGIARALKSLNDAATEIALACERAFQSALDGSCRTPIAGHAIYSNRRLTFRGEVLAPDGSNSAACQFEMLLGDDALVDAAVAGRSAGMELKSRAWRWLAL